MKTLSEIKEELKKGCGKWTYSGTDRAIDDFECGNNNNHKEINKLCPLCKAKLSILTEYDKAIKEMIEDLQIKYPFSALVLDKLKGELK